MAEQQNARRSEKRASSSKLTESSANTRYDSKRVAMTSLTNHQVIDGVKDHTVKAKQKEAERVLQSDSDSENKITVEKTSDGVNTDYSSRQKTAATIRSKAEFTFEGRLGKGGFGKVYKVRHEQQGNYYAMKVVPEREGCRKETAALSRLQHSNIVRYFECWTENTDAPLSSTEDSSQSSNESCEMYLYILLELCKPQTLREWIDERNDKKDLQDFNRRFDSLTIILQIVSGVEYIHSKYFTHRDLKPANILFGLDGHVRIGDFGLAATECDDFEELMEEQGFLRAKLYVAPEQLEKNFTRKIDIFPLGLIYFELLWRIYTGHQRAEIWGDIRKQKFPEKFSEYFKQEFHIVKSMLNLKPEGRPEASAVKKDLENFKRELYT